MKIFTFLLLMGIIPYCTLYAQSSKTTRNFGRPIISDSTSTIIIPTIYDVSLFTSNKLALWGDFYSNIVFYNFVTDRSKKLFDNDTYIVGLDGRNYSYYGDRKPGNSISSKWIFYRVLNTDRNKNNKIDNEDPAILYVSDLHGDNLKALTSPDENVVDLILYEKQGIAMAKVQRDENKDGAFTDKDNNFYFVKIDLATLAFGNKIEPGN